ncbi:SHOCT domain-containing protein [Janibacter sp. G1551]|uniref:SHOCT domain-containing protein n=1 Tax=Janibacter sp. G1551 TaxID=3420440 RepID=UPI003CFDCE15
MMWSNGMGWGGWLFMVLATVSFWALVAFAVMALFRGSRSDTTPYGRSGEQDASQVLDQRFARGEIDVDEYHARKDVLRSAH